MATKTYTIELLYKEGKGATYKYERVVLWTLCDSGRIFVERDMDKAC